MWDRTTQGLKADGCQIDYGKADYWDQRYTERPDAYDWCDSWDRMKPILEMLLPKDASILQVGVGNSTMQIDMARDGYRHIENTDISSVVVDNMNASNEFPEVLTNRVSDCTNMPEYADGSYDIVLDKGTIDALLWSMDPAGNVYRLLSEASRVVKEGGTFMYIGYGVPDARLHHLAHPDHHFDVQFWTINKLPEFMLIQAKKQGTRLPPAIIEGPFDARDREAVLKHSATYGMPKGYERMPRHHYIYVCRRKPGPKPEQLGQVHAVDLGWNTEAAGAPPGEG